MTEMFHVALAKPAEEVVVELAADARERIFQDDPVGPAGDGDTIESLSAIRAGQAGWRADDLVKRAVHRAQPGTAGQTSVPSMSKSTSLGMMMGCEVQFLLQEAVI